MARSIIRILQTCAFLSIALLFYSRTFVYAAEDMPPYAVQAQLFLQAPLVVHASVRGQSKLSRKDKAILPALLSSQDYSMLTVDLETVIKAPAALPGRIQVLWRGSLGPDGKIPSFKKHALIFFLSEATDAKGRYTLIDSDAAFFWSQPLIDQLRAIAAEAQTSGGQEIKGIRAALVNVSDGVERATKVHILFNTADRSPLAAVLQRAPGEWSFKVTTNDTDEGAVSVRPKTLLWYYLACGLPPVPPPHILDQPSARDKNLVSQSYLAMVQQLGPCPVRYGAQP